MTGAWLGALVAGSLRVTAPCGCVSQGSRLLLVCSGHNRAERDAYETVLARREAEIAQVRRNLATETAHVERLITANADLVAEVTRLRAAVVRRLGTAAAGRVFASAQSPATVDAEGVPTGAAFMARYYTPELMGERSYRRRSVSFTEAPAVTFQHPAGLRPALTEEDPHA